MQAISPSESLVQLRLAEAEQRDVLACLHDYKAVLDGHFALHRGRHSTKMLRFRGIGRDATALVRVTRALSEQLPAQLKHALELPGVKLLCPETAGFFLANALSRKYEAELVITQTDLRRLPTKSLLAGSIRSNDRIVIVNDVAGTGASIESLRELAVERHARVEGILTFGVVDEHAFRRYCEQARLPAHWLVTAGWKTHTPEVDCPGCSSRAPLMPVAELI
jgi:adenine/guanine phosphoribosyltransferase-like PRPP-binding protein